jgi:hypothetical protein
MADSVQRGVAAACRDDPAVSGFIVNPAAGRVVARTGCAAVTGWSSDWTGWIGSRRAATWPQLMPYAGAPDRNGPAIPTYRTMSAPHVDVVVVKHQSDRRRSLSGPGGLCEFFVQAVADFLRRHIDGMTAARSRRSGLSIHGWGAARS